MNIQHLLKITIVLRDHIYLQTRTAVKNLMGSKLCATEITVNTPGTLEAIEKVSQESGDSVMVGTGTVLIYEETQASIAAGIAFSLSLTMLGKRVLDLHRKRDVANVPEAFSLMGIKRSFENGAGIVKVFPTARLGSRYLSDVVAPSREVPLMMVGGIGTANVGEYFAARASLVGVASGIFDKQDILSQSEAGIRASIQAMEEKLRKLERDL